jgi:hypothetical protein
MTRPLVRLKGFGKDSHALSLADLLNLCTSKPPTLS